MFPPSKSDGEESSMRKLCERSVEGERVVWAEVADCSIKSKSFESTEADLRNRDGPVNECKEEVEDDGEK